MEEFIESHVETLSAAELRAHPERVTHLLMQEKDFAIIIEKKGDKIQLGYRRIFEDDVHRILQETKEDHTQEVSTKLDREKEMEEFLALRQQIIRQYF